MEVEETRGAVPARHFAQPRYQLLEIQQVLQQSIGGSPRQLSDLQYTVIYSPPTHICIDHEDRHLHRLIFQGPAQCVSNAITANLSLRAD